MPRKNQAGERFRDEQRAGGPRQHGGAWRDPEDPRELESVQVAVSDAIPEVEASGEREGMGKGAVPRKAKGRARGGVASPRGKGRPGARGA